MLVKICGITTLTAAHEAVKAGADWVGFVFAPSKRRISGYHAKSIIETLPSSVQTVGVFVNEQAEVINEMAEDIGLDVIQLHGDETPDVAKQLPYPIIKAFSIDHINKCDIQSYPCDYYLIDSPRTTFYGGSGQSFDWELLQQWSLDKSKMILAGGLTAKNVQHAIRIVRPLGVDVSSGVETDGFKDADKIKQFIQQVNFLRS